MNLPVVLNSMVSGILFYTAYQFLFIGVRNRKHPEYITFGFIVMLQATCALIELFGITSENQHTYLINRHIFFNISGVINILFFIFIGLISSFRHKFWFYTYIFFVFVTLVINNVTDNIVFINQTPHYQLKIIETNFMRPWTVGISLVFELATTLQYIPLIVFSLLAWRLQRTINKGNAYFIVLSLFLFLLGITSDITNDLGIIHYPISSYFYLILIIYISTQLYKNIENAKRFEDQAHEVEKRIRQIIDLSPNLIFAKDIQGRFIFVNKAFAHIYNRAAEDLIGRTHEDFFHIPQEIEFFRQKDLEVINSGKQLFIPEETFTDRNGNTQILQTNKIPFTYDGTKAILGVSTYITALKQAETTLKNNEQLLETIFENASIAMVLIDHKSEVLKINKAGKKLGMDPFNDLKGFQPGNALNCIVAHNNEQGCGHGKECSACALRSTIKATMTNREGVEKVPHKIFVKNENMEEYYDILISTSYIENNDSPLVLVVLEDITAIEKVERALVESEYRYKEITRAITDYIYTVIVHDNGEIQTIHTPACFPITGYQAEEFEADPSLWLNIIVDEDREKVLNHIRNQSKSQEIQYIEHRIIHKNGEERWMSNTLVKKNRKNAADQYDGVIRDITYRKLTEVALDNQNKLFNTMLVNLPIGIFMVNVPDGTPLIANEQAKKLLGQGILPDVDLTNITDVYTAFKAGTDQPYPTKEMPIIMGMKGKYGHIDDLEVEHPDGSRILLEIVGCPVYDTNNNIWASLVGFYDITARKNAEHALRESEKKLSVIFEYSHVGISLSDHQGNIQYMNPAFCKILDYQPDQDAENSFQLFTDPKLIDSEVELFDKLRKGQLNNLNIEKKFSKITGENVYVQIQVSCFRNAKGEIANFIAVVEDITERINVVDSLRASEEKFRNIFNTSNDAILIVDFESRILEANHTTINRSGYSLEQIKDKRLIDLFIAPNDHVEAEHQFLNLSQNKTALLQSNYINQRGEKIYIEIIGHPITYNGKQLALLVSRNITERVISQQRILNAIIEAEEKERSFFSQELHDGIGPILSTIKLYLEWIQNPNAKSDKSNLLSDALNTVEDAIVSIKEISNRLSPNVLTKFGLETAIQSFIKKIESLGKVHFSVSINLPLIRIRPEIEAMLYRVFVEAINNSLKYANASNVVIQINTDANGLSALFSDNGIGFNINEILSQKTGHGLFNMQHRVETYEGTFSLKSKPGEGTEIIIAIPLHKYLIVN